MSETRKFGSNEGHLLAASQYLSNTQNDPEKRSKPGISEIQRYVADYATEMRMGAEVNLVLTDGEQIEDRGRVSFQRFERVEEDGWHVVFEPVPEGEKISVAVGSFDLPTQAPGQQEL